MQIEIVKQDQRFYIRKQCGYSGRKSSRIWMEYYTGNHTWSENKSEANLFASQERAIDFMERVVAIVGINQK